MVGHEDEDRAPEPLLAAEAFEETAEGLVVVGHALVDLRITVGQRRRVLFGHDERVVRREGEERGEEGFGHGRELLAHELQEGFVPDAPVAVEIPRAVPRLVVFAAYEPFDARRTGVGPEAHRTVLRPAEEGRRVAPVGEHGRQLAAPAERLRHQHEGGAERRDASQHRRHGLNRARTVGIHPPEGQPLAHQRVEERRESLLRKVGVDLRAQVCGVLGRHALHDEDHDVARAEVQRRAVGRLVLGREVLRKLLLGEDAREVPVFGVPCGTEDTEGVAQNEVCLAAVRGVERGVREGDRARHARHAAAGPGDAQSGGEGQQQRPARVVGPASAQQALFAHPAAVGPGQQRRERRPHHDKVPVLGHELPDELQRIVVVGEEDLVGGEPLLRIAEIDRIGEVRGHDEQRVDRDVAAVEQAAVPAPFAQVQRQQREQDEGPVGIDYRDGVEFQCAGEELSDFAEGQRAQQRGVVEVERETAQHQHRIKHDQPPHQHPQRCAEQA